MDIYLPSRFAGEKHQSILSTNTALLQVGKKAGSWIKPLLQATVKTIMKWSGVESEIGEF